MLYVKGFVKFKQTNNERYRLSWLNKNEIELNHTMKDIVLNVINVNYPTEKFIAMNNMV